MTLNAVNEDNDYSLNHLNVLVHIKTLSDILFTFIGNLFYWSVHLVSFGA